MTEKIVATSSALIERRTSRRGFLVRLAVVGSALTVAPLRYLLRPESAWAIVRPRTCSSRSRCGDGYTAFCCTINGGRNACPPYSFVGGWWKCTHYRGARLCGNKGVRYYLDCNRTPGHRCPHGCHCPGGTCRERRMCCNVFRYGQCNTHVHGVTEVVCRMVVCRNPAHLRGNPFNCNATYRRDDNTCGHEAPCL